MHPETGDLWLTEERFRKPVKRIANINHHVLLALAADLTAENGTKTVTRDIKFSDGKAIRVTIEEVEDPHDDQARSRNA